MTQNPTIYRINRKNRLLKFIKDVPSTIKYILTHNPIIEKTGDEILELISTYESERNKYYLFLDNNKEAASDWRDFLPAELTQERNFYQQLLSLILFVETERDLLAVVGGTAFRIVLPYIDETYGLTTYSKIMLRDKDELISIKSRGITGNRVGMNEQFRKDFRIMDFIRFGKFPTEIQVKLSNEITNTHFGFLKTKGGDRMHISVNKGFKVKKAMTFNDLDTLITELIFIKGLAPSDYLSSYEEVTDVGFIRDQLYPLLIQSIYDDIPRINRTISDDFISGFEFDFCDPNNIEKFYEADCYQLKSKTDNGGHRIFKTVYNKDAIYESVMKQALEHVGENDKFQLMVFLQGVRVVSYHNNKKTVASSFLYHFNAEFSLDEVPYFLIDTKWFKLRENFVNELVVDSLHIFRNNRLPKVVLDVPWDKKMLSKEKDYNLTYLGRDGYIVTDTFTPEGIELCDLIHYDDDNVYLIHVKYGFGGSVRELTNQITLSARRLKECLGTVEKKWLDEVFGLAQNAGNIYSLTLDEFKRLFTTKKISYVLAFTCHLKEDLLIENNIERFKSNIAKFSLIQCSSDMRQSYYELYVNQIRRA